MLSRVISPQMAKAGVARLRKQPEGSKDEVLVSWVKRNGGQVRLHRLVCTVRMEDQASIRRGMNSDPFCAQATNPQYVPLPSKA